MTTLLDVRNRVADMLARSDLNTQIEREIQLAITRYNRRVTWLHEVRGATLTTVIGQTYYSTIDVSGGDALQSVTGRTAVSVADVQKIDYMRDSDFDELRQVRYSDFERFFDTSGSTGGPDYFTLYAGRIGLWPIPDVVETFTLSVQCKPVVPSATSDTSIWFTQAQELIESAAASAVCAKFIMDTERAGIFAGQEQAHFNDMVREGGLKMATGRLRSHE